MRSASGKSKVTHGRVFSSGNRRVVDSFSDSRESIRARASKRRGTTGSTIAEMGPALFIILFFGVFLVVDLISLGFAYCACQSLNDLQLREASKISSAQAKADDGPIKQGIPSQWVATTMGGLAGVDGFPVTEVDYDSGLVTVSTTVAIRPALTIPIFPGVPGLGAPLSFNVTGSRVMENY